MRHLHILLILLTVSACSKLDTAPGAGGVTVGEARALDEAAEMLDARRPPAVSFATGDSATEAAAEQP